MTNFIFIFICYLYMSYENLCLLPVKILYNLFSYIIINSHFHLNADLSIIYNSKQNKFFYIILLLYKTLIEIIIIYINLNY